MKKELWVCPKCGHKFVTKNLWHSCGKYRIPDHFKGRPKNLYRTFRLLKEIFKEIGPVTIYAQKTRIVIMRRVRFAGFIVRKDDIDFSLWIKRKASHPKIIRIEKFGDESFGIHFQLSKPEDIDKNLKLMIQETYSDRLW